LTNFAALGWYKLNLDESVLERWRDYRRGCLHLHSFRERVRINQELISAERVVEFRRLQAIEPRFSTFFEWVTALAFIYFAARAQVDINPRWWRWVWGRHRICEVNDAARCIDYSISTATTWIFSIHFPPKSL